MYQYLRNGGAYAKSIDPFGYYLVGCRVGANGFHLHDEVEIVQVFTC